MNRSPHGHTISLKIWTEALTLFEGCKDQARYSEAMNHFNQIAIATMNITDDVEDHFAHTAAKEYMWIPKLRRDMGTAFRLIVSSYGLHINIESLESFR